MKKLIGLLLLATSLISVKAATLAWNPNPESDISHYSVYQSVNGGPITKIGSVTNNTSFVVNPLGGSNYAYRVTAINTAFLESDFSEAVPYFSPLGIPPENTILTKSIADYQGGAWQTVRFSWAAIDMPKYGVTNYVVNIKTLPAGTINRVTTTSTSYTFPSLSLGDYEIYVTTQNSLGTSPTSPASIWTLSSRKPNAPLGVRLQ